MQRPDLAVPTSNSANEWCLAGKTPSPSECLESYPTASGEGDSRRKARLYERSQY